MSPQSPSNSSTTTEAAEGGKNPASGFGANEWLVDEIYQQYLQDPNSVDRAWWDFFADYKPGGAVAPVKSDGPQKPATTDGASAQAATTVSAAPQVTDAAATGRRAPQPLLRLLVRAPAPLERLPPRQLLRPCPRPPLLLPPPLVPLL